MLVNLDFMTSFSGMSMAQILSEMGNGLRIHRLNAALTQKDAALKCQCSVLTIQHMESGRSVSTKNLILYIQALGAWDMLSGFKDVHQFPKRYKTHIVFAKRTRTKKNYGKPDHR